MPIHRAYALGYTCSTPSGGFSLCSNLVARRDNKAYALGYICFLLEGDYVATASHRDSGHRSNFTLISSFGVLLQPGT